VRDLTDDEDDDDDDDDEVDEEVKEDKSSLELVAAATDPASSRSGSGPRSANRWRTMAS
jgi:hypothetical protein